MIATIGPSQTNVAGGGHIDDRQSVVRERDAADDRVAGAVWTAMPQAIDQSWTVWQDQGAGAPLDSINPAMPLVGRKCPFGRFAPHIREA